MLKTKAKVNEKREGKKRKSTAIFEAFFFSKEIKSKNHSTMLSGERIVKIKIVENVEHYMGKTIILQTVILSSFIKSTTN